MTVGNNMYVFVIQRAWILNLEDYGKFKSRSLTKPMNIKHYLSTNSVFTHVFKERNKDLVLFFYDNLVTIQLPYFRQTSDKIINVKKDLNIPTNSKIHGLFSFYTGQVFLFYDNAYFVEVEETNWSVLRHVLIQKEFSGNKSL